MLIEAGAETPCPCGLECLHTYSDADIRDLLDAGKAATLCPRSGSEVSVAALFQG